MRIVFHEAWMFFLCSLFTTTTKSEARFRDVASYMFAPIYILLSGRIVLPPKSLQVIYSIWLVLLQLKFLNILWDCFSTGCFFFFSLQFPSRPFVWRYETWLNDTNKYMCGQRGIMCRKWLLQWLDMHGALDSRLCALGLAMGMHF